MAAATPALRGAMRPAAHGYAAALQQPRSRFLQADTIRHNYFSTSLLKPSAANIKSRRHLHGNAARPGQASAAAEAPEPAPAQDNITNRNEPLSFPCLDAVERRTSSLASRRFSTSGPEPSYTSGAHKVFQSQKPLLLDWGGLLPSFDIAYETWGTLNADKSNAILLSTGLSASSHAHSTPENGKPGWWEKFIGSGAPLDTDKYFIICTNVLGGCYGSTGPSSFDPATGARYGTSFPILTMEDMVRAQFRVLDFLGIQKLYAAVGSSMGGMQSLASGVLFPSRVGRVASISGCARSHPYSIAMRHTQRQVLMVDPNWKRGFYYDGVPPHAGMKLARQIATITYRSGPEWEQRFGRRRADPNRAPALCPDFLIETYLDHAGEKWCLEYDANSLLYISKAMDLFDLGADHQRRTRERRQENQQTLDERLQQGESSEDISGTELFNLTLPDQPYEEQPQTASKEDNKNGASTPPGIYKAPPQDLIKGLAPLSRTPTLVMGVASDILFPAWQQREVADALKQTGNKNITHIELGEDKSLFGHDTFLLDLVHVGGSLRTFLS